MTVIASAKVFTDPAGLIIAFTPADGGADISVTLPPAVVAGLFGSIGQLAMDAIQANPVALMLDLWRRVEAQVTSIQAQLTVITEKENTIMATLADLAQDVAANTTVTGSAVALLQGLHDQLAAAIATGDPVVIDQLRTDLQAATASLAAAVTANTPAAAEAAASAAPSQSA